MNAKLSEAYFEHHCIYIKEWCGCSGSQTISGRVQTGQ